MSASGGESRRSKIMIVDHQRLVTVNSVGDYGLRVGLTINLLPDLAANGNTQNAFVKMHHPLPVFCFAEERIGQLSLSRAACVCRCADALPKNIQCQPTILTHPAQLILQSPRLT